MPVTVQIHTGILCQVAKTPCLGLKKQNKKNKNKNNKDYLSVFTKQVILYANFCDSAYLFPCAQP